MFPLERACGLYIPLQYYLISRDLDSLDPSESVNSTRALEKMIVVVVFSVLYFVSQSIK